MADSTTGYLALVNQDEIVMSIWVPSTMVYGSCVLRAVWDARHLDRFFSVSFHSYFALITLVNSCVNHAVHQWEPVFFSQHLLGLSFS